MMDVSSSSSAATTTSSFVKSNGHQTNSPPPSSTHVVPTPSGNRDVEVVQLMEQLCRHMVPPAPDNCSDDAAAISTAVASRVHEEESLLRSCLYKLGTCRRPPDAALDDFFTLQQAQRKVRRWADLNGEDDGGRADAARLQELFQKLGKPALKGQLKHGWAALHLLTLLSRGRPGQWRGKGEGMGRRDPAMLDSFVSADLPHALRTPAPLPAMPAAAPSSTCDDSILSMGSLTVAGSQGSRPGGRAPPGHPITHALPVSYRNRGPGSMQRPPDAASFLPPSPNALAMARQSHSWVEATDGDALELALLRDCLYAFQGIEGRLIKFDPGAEAHILHPSLSLSYGPGALDVVLHVTEMGWLFRKISEFAGRARRSPREMGVVGQALGHVLEDEITEYYRLMAVLETQLNEQEQQDHRPARRPPPPPAPCAHDTSLYSTFTAAAARPGGLTLRRLAVWVEEPLQRLRLLGTMCDSMHHVRGGALISVLHLHSQQGDSVARSLIHRMLSRVSLPLFEMLRRWILEGELSDAHGEFFVVVVADPQGRESRRERAPGLGAPHTQDSDESLWHHRYALRPGMIPRFLPEALAHKILVLGKSINFMRRCCCDQGWSDSEPRGNPSSSASTLLPTAEARHARQAAELYEFSHDKMDGLQGVVDGVAAVVNARLLSLLMGPRYQLMAHLRALKKFITLAQGDFVTCLLDAVGPELSKSADQLYRHDLTGKLEAALRTSNAQYEDTDILNRVGVRLLPASGGEEGWEVFVLDYHVHAPVSAVVHRKALETYARIFQLLFRVKRVEWALGTSWKEHMMVGQLPRRGGGGREDESRMACILQRCNLTRREMVHFVANLSSFMWFEVLEASWTQLEADIGAASDLDAVIAAHDAYLLRVTQTSFLSPDKAPFLTALQDVLSSILGFCALHADLCREVLRAKELDRASEKAVGSRGVVGEERAEAAGTGVKREGGIKVGPYEERVEVTTARFERACEELIDLLHAQDRGTQAAVAEADAVRFLVFRLDFNLFYTHQRLARGRQASFDKPAVPAEGSIPVL